MHAQSPEHLLDHPESDVLGTSVLRTLSRSYRNQFSMGPVRAGLLALFTFGVAPLWRMRSAFRGFVTLEKQQLWHLGEWLRNRRGGEEASAVADAISRLRLRQGISSLTTICLIAVTFGLIVVLTQSGGVHAIVARTCQFTTTGRDPKFFVFWLITLCAGYTLHLIQICLHTQDIKKFAVRFNALAAREGVAPIVSPAAPVGMSVPWLILAILFLFKGALWAVPMAIACVAQRRYINETSLAFREQLLDRMRAMLHQRKPAVAVPSFVIHGRRCGNVLCRATLPAGARFCTRCGAAVTRLGEVA